MSTAPDNPLPPERLRVMQIIAAALLVGVLIFLGIVLYVVLIHNQGQGLGPRRDFPYVTAIAVVILLVDAPLVVFIPRTITQNALKQMAAGTWKAPSGTSSTEATSDAAKLLLVRQTTLIIALALFEGVAFLALIAFLLETEVAALAVVAGAIILMLVSFPGERRVRVWLDLHLQRLTDLRQQRELQS